MPDPVIRFYFEKAASLANRRTLRAFLIELFKIEKTPLLSLQYIFCTDEYLIGINRHFLQHDYYTDIITFNLASAGQPVEGEIYISIDRVRENAVAFKSNFREELHR